eukprot:SAG25_NODE_10807_length_322_cov_0.910314_2_plen_42_part_01
MKLKKLSMFCLSISKTSLPAAVQVIGDEPPPRLAGLLAGWLA